MHGGTGFKSPALLPLRGREMSRDRGWPELVLLRVFCQLSLSRAGTGPGPTRP